MTPRPKNGFALLIVLWTLVLLSLIVSRLTSTGGSEARIANNLAQNAVAEAVADGAVAETVYHLLDQSADGWKLDGSPHRLQLPGGRAVVTIQSEQGKINPNIAPPELLKSLLMATGVDSAKATNLSAAIADWREAGNQPRPNGAKAAQYLAAGLDYVPPGEPMQSIDELGRVLGMTPDILSAMRPHLSLFQMAMPDPAAADPVVKAALLQSARISPVVMSNGFSTVSIAADATSDSKARVLRRTVIRLRANNRLGYTILDWAQDPASS